MNALATLTQTLAAKLNMGDGTGLIDTLKATAFKAKDGVSDAQMTALMVVANQYGLNPWTKEIYAYPDKQNGIVPVVGLDGWSRIINSNPQFDGMDFEQTDESCTCTIYRKDRTRPVRVTEYLSECYRAPFKSKENYEIKGPWQSHPKRMLRHKSMIQCARLAFGFGGIYDQDEAERIVEASAPIKDMGMAVSATAPYLDPQPVLATIENCSTLEQLKIVWAENNSGFAGQIDDYARIKKACTAKRIAIESSLQEAAQ